MIGKPYSITKSSKSSARAGWVSFTHIFPLYDTFRRHFRTQIAPEKNKNGLKDNKNKDW